MTLSRSPDDAVRAVELGVHDVALVTKATNAPASVRVIDLGRMERAHFGSSTARADLEVALAIADAIAGSPAVLPVQIGAALGLVPCGAAEPWPLLAVRRTGGVGALEARLDLLVDTARALASG